LISKLSFQRIFLRRHRLGVALVDKVPQGLI
jgi:hypothetical protein